MLKKMLKNASVLLLSLSLLIPIQLLCTNAQETAPTDKIDNSILGQMDDSDDYIDIQIYFSDSNCDTQKLLDEMGIPDERVISYVEPYIWAKPDEIYDIVANDKVSFVAAHDYDQEVCVYTVESAVRILRAVVGEESEDLEKYMRWGEDIVYDMNQDGRITTLDACMALQSAVGNIKVGTGPQDFALQRKARLLEKDALNNAQ